MKPDNDPEKAASENEVEMDFADGGLLSRSKWFWIPIVLMILWGVFLNVSDALNFF